MRSVAAKCVYRDKTSIGAICVARSAEESRRIPHEPQFSIQYMLGWGSDEKGIKQSLLENVYICHIGTTPFPNSSPVNYVQYSNGLFLTSICTCPPAPNGTHTHACAARYPPAPHPTQSDPPSHAGTACSRRSSSRTILRAIRTSRGLG